MKLVLFSDWSLNALPADEEQTRAEQDHGRRLSGCWLRHGYRDKAAGNTRDNYTLIVELIDGEPLTFRKKSFRALTPDRGEQLDIYDNSIAYVGMVHQREGA